MYTLPSDFASLENVFTLVFYFLNSTLLFDLARRIFSTRFIKLHLPSHISNSTLKIFNTTSEFLFTLQWLLIKTICRGVGHGWLFSPSCFARKCLPAPSHFQVIGDLCLSKNGSLEFHQRETSSRRWRTSFSGWSKWVKASYLYHLSLRSRRLSCAWLPWSEFTPADVLSLLNAWFKPAV